MKFKAEQWIAAIVMAASTGIAITVFAYSTFETKARVSEVKADLTKTGDDRHRDLIDRLKAIDANVAAMRGVPAFRPEPPIAPTAAVTSSVR